MRRVAYGGVAFYTGDEIAAALLEYARELARNATADTVLVPARSIDGENGTIEVLLGPASQLVSEPLTLVGPEILDEDFVHRLHALSERLSARRPGPEHPFITDDLPGGLE